MSRWGSCDFSGLEKLAKSIDELAEEEIVALFEVCVKALAARLLALVIPLTPVGNYNTYRISEKGRKVLVKKSAKQGGTLRRGWTGKIDRNSSKDYANSLTVTKKGGNYMVEIINPVEYASYVEYGHRSKNGGWVPGKFMLTISEAKLKSASPAILEKIISRKLKEIFNG